MKSVVTEFTEICAICGKPRECDHHLVFGTGLRELSDKDGLIIPMCNRCHNMGIATTKLHENIMAEALSKMLGQLAWEKEFYKQLSKESTDIARITFMKRYGRSYL